ncbi:MAG: cyclase family protein [Acidobacteriota bacterium]
MRSPSYRLVDVSHWMEDYTFAGNPKVEAQGPFNRVWGDLRENVYDLALCTQSGTHVQGPHYFWEEGKRLDELPLHLFEGEAIILDLPLGEVASRADIQGALEEVESPRPPIVILRTGWMDRLLYGPPASPGEARASLSLEAATYLAESYEATMVAVDAPGVEPPQAARFEVTRYLSRRGVLLLEGLVGLDQLRHRRVFLEAFPLKLRGVEGSPCRAVIKEPLTVS